MENEKDTTLTTITSGSKYFSNVRSPAPSHTQTLSNPFRNLTNKVRSKLFYKEVFLRLSVCVVYYCVFIIVYYCVVVMLHEHVYVYISIFIMWVYNINSWPAIKEATKRNISFRLIKNYFFLSKYLQLTIIRSLLFAHGPIEYKSFLNRSIWTIDGALTGTDTLRQSVPGNNSNEAL